MGSPASERGRYVDEGPRHRVTFAQPFAVSRFAATFDEWDACLADGGCNGVRPGDNGWGRGRRPVIKVSWDDAKAYVAWLARKTGRPYRLLSEAEHEYATRAGTTTPFWTGSTISTKQANFNSQKSAPVDEYGPNPWGLYQLRGNVREWTEDCYRDGYKGAPTDGGPWSAAGCTKHVLRGGSWNFELATLLRSAARASYEDRDDDIGFRVARSLAPRAGAVASRGARLSRRGR
jgi:formylglycine-generating enzyme required for sulfatase activity